MLWQVYFLLALMFNSTTCIDGTFTTEVFIPTVGRSKKSASRSGLKFTATDAAVAMNSIEFVEILSKMKNTADVETYTKPSIKASTGVDNNTAKQWSFSSRMFGRSDGETVQNNPNNLDCLVSSTNAEESGSKQPKSSCTSHETVSEYMGILWFLPGTKGIKFRETIRIVSISPNGQSSTIECTTQYHNGSRWVDCSNIICVFSSVPFDSIGNDAVENVDEVRVKMTLECEVLVWLPLPKAASKQVGKKISSVFETAALDFFEELDS